MMSEQIMEDGVLFDIQGRLYPNDCIMVDIKGYVLEDGKPPSTINDQNSFVATLFASPLRGKDGFIELLGNIETGIGKYLKRDIPMSKLRSSIIVEAFCYGFRPSDTPNIDEAQVKERESLQTASLMMLQMM
jgi:hypothetical protein